MIIPLIAGLFQLTSGAKICYHYQGNFSSGDFTELKLTFELKNVTLVVSRTSHHGVEQMLVQIIVCQQHHQRSTQFSSWIRGKNLGMLLTMGTSIQFLNQILMETNIFISLFMDILTQELSFYITKPHGSIITYVFRFLGNQNF